MNPVLRRLRHPRRAEPAVTRAVASMNLGRFEEAYDAVRLRRGHGALTLGAATAVMLGRADEAARRLRRIRGCVPNPGVAAAVGWARGEEEKARAALAVAPDRIGALGALTLTTVLLRRGVDVDRELGHLTEETAVWGVSAALFFEGRYADSARWSQRGTTGELAVNVACALTRLGDLDGALRWVATAAERGMEDPGMVDADPDLAPLRAHPGWAEARARLGDPERPTSL